jgi:hypothetical protein
MRGAVNNFSYVGQKKIVNLVSLHQAKTCVAGKMKEIY